MNPADVRALFPGLGDTIYLNTATMAVGCAPAREAYERALHLWCAGRFDWTEAERAGEQARTLFAQIVNAVPDEIALVPAVSSAAGIVATNMPRARRGENVVVAEKEFSSNFFPWLMLRERGYEVRTVAFTGDGVSADSYREVMDGGTRLVAASAVHSATGFRTDVAALSRSAQACGAWLFVDACQAAGAVSVDVVRDGVDFLAAASHKFLLGSRGMGYLFVRRGLLETMRPVHPGWKAGRKPLESFYGPAMDLSATASKLDASLPWFAALAEVASLSVLARFGLQQVIDRNAALTRHLRDGLLARGLAPQPSPEAHHSTIVSVPVPDTEAAMARLSAAGVVASARANRVRLAVHFYNLEEEIDRVAELLAGA